MLWVVFALLTGLAVFSVLWPLARRPQALDRTEADVAFYRAQIAEIDRDVTLGLSAATDAEAARAEAGRRLLAASQRSEAPGGRGRAAPRVAAVLALVGVPAVALGLYARLGSPDLPDEPLVARHDTGPGAELMAAVAKIESHLLAHPEDGRGHEVLAPIYLRLGRPVEAAGAYSAALRLLGETPQRRANYAEALVAAANGTVTAEARESFEQARAEDPKNDKAALYLGLAAEQDGDKALALRIWGDELAHAPADAYWVPMLRARVAQLSGPDAAPAGAAPGIPAPPPAAAAAIAALPANDQQMAIRGMVDRLATRLADQGQDLNGWLRLIRAYSVLKDADKARQALADAKRNLGHDAAARAQIDALARELGLEG
jgi:cytochrome c-type biogenesis protein CcmH